MERTLALIKPDAVAAGVVGDIISLIEAENFEIDDITKRLLTREVAEDFYSEHRGRPFFESLIDFTTAGPVVALILRADNAIERWRKLIGPTDPAVARVNGPGTVRARFGTELPNNNAVHGSCCAKDAEREIAVFFPTNNATAEDLLDEIDTLKQTLVELGDRATKDDVKAMARAARRAIIHCSEEPDESGMCPCIKEISEMFAALISRAERAEAQRSLMDATARNFDRAFGDGG